MVPRATTAATSTITSTTPTSNGAGATSNVTAVITASTTPAQGDRDFVFTLSDHDDYDDDEGDGYTQSTLLNGSQHGRDEVDRENEGMEVRVRSKKRKRGDGRDENTRLHQEKGKRKKKESVPDKSFLKEGRGTTHAVSDEDEEEQGEDDGVLNPDFEFLVPGLVVSEDEEGFGFDAWGIRANGKSGVDGDEAHQPKKAAADVDEIIRRRRVARMTAEDDHIGRAGADPSQGEVSDLEPGPGEKMQQEGEMGADEDGDDEMEEPDEENFPGLDDDDILAPEEFGAGLLDGDEEEQNDASPEEDGTSDQDADSIASPTAHPDDVASPASESETSVEDPEEVSKRAAFFAPESDSKQITQSQSPVIDSDSFHSFSLSRPILKGLSTLGFTKPTPIQRRTIPVALLGKDVVGSAVTGSGKTAAFLLPILERLLYRPRKVPTTRVAILMPTRELAVQCYAVATKLASYTDVTFAQLVGGFSLREQETVLKKRPDVVIATPGRFIDHMRNSASFTVDTIEILVLDEADRMLQDGFATELNEIIASIPASRQTMLFSATMTESVDSLIRVGLNRPVRLMVDRSASTVTTLTQEFVRLRPGREKKRLAYLVHLCKEIHTSRTIIFFREKKSAHRTRIIFTLLNLRAGELHGSMTQDQRITAVEAFRAGKTDFLLATDLASRGLDIRGVETVINYEAPATHDLYLHRVGRTARAGKTGRACTLAAEADRKVVRAAVKSASAAAAVAQAQSSKIISRSIDAAEADSWAARLDALEQEVNDVLNEERQERQLAQAENEVRRADNLVDHREEIMARPKRTWFETGREREKREKREKRGKSDRARVGDPTKTTEKGKKGKRKLSGKEKKRLDSRRERVEGVGATTGAGGNGKDGLWKKRKGKGLQQTARTGAESGKGGGNGKMKMKTKVQSK